MQHPFEHAWHGKSSSEGVAGKWAGYYTIQNHMVVCRCPVRLCVRYPGEAPQCDGIHALEGETDGEKCELHSGCRCRCLCLSSTPAEAERWHTHQLVVGQDDHCQFVI